MNKTITLPYEEYKEMVEKLENYKQGKSSLYDDIKSELDTGNPIKIGRITYDGQRHSLTFYAYRDKQLTPHNDH